MLNGRITQENAASIIGVHPRTVLRWLNAGKIPHIRIGSRRYLTRQLLDEWMRSSRRDNERQS